MMTLEGQNEEDQSDVQPAVRSGRWTAMSTSRRIIAVGIVVALLLGAAVVIRGRSDGSTAGHAVTAAQLEKQYGMRVDLVALTALGGMIQLRFTVLDKNKAEQLFHTAEKMPMLIANPSGKQILAPSGMRHHVTLLDGGAYFVLYANPGGVVTPGSDLSVMIDNVVLEHLTAQS